MVCQVLVFLEVLGVNRRKRLPSLEPSSLSESDESVLRFLDSFFLSRADVLAVNRPPGLLNDLDSNLNTRKKITQSITLFALCDSSLAIMFFSFSMVIFDQNSKNFPSFLYSFDRRRGFPIL